MRQPEADGRSRPVRTDSGDFGKRSRRVRTPFGDLGKCLHPPRTSATDLGKRLQEVRTPFGDLGKRLHPPRTSAADLGKRLHPPRTGEFSRESMDIFDDDLSLSRLRKRLPMLVHVLTSKDNRESLSHALAELADALHTVERTTAASTPA